MRVEPVLVHELVQHARADGRARDVGEQVAERLLGHAHVDAHELEQRARRACPRARSRQIGRRSPSSYTSRAARRVAGAADVGQVRDAHRVADDAAVAEHGLHDVDVEQVSGADPRIVGHRPRRRARSVAGGKRSSIAASVAGAVPVNDGTL